MIIKYWTCVFVLIGLNNCIGQSNFNKVFEFDYEDIRCEKIYLINDQIIIPCNVIENGKRYASVFKYIGSELVEFKIKELVFALNPLVNVGNQFFLIGKEPDYQPNHIKIVKIDTLNYSIIWENKFDTDGDINFISDAGGFNNFIYVLNAIKTFPLSWKYIQIHKIDIAGNLVWEKPFSLESIYSTAWDIQQTSDSNLIFSQLTQEPPQYNLRDKIYKIDSTGEIINQYSSNSTPPNGAIPINILAIEHNSLILANEVDMRGNFEYTQNNWNIYPSVVWKIDSIGNTKNKFIYNVPKTHDLLFVDFVKGQNEYFFGLGEFRYPDYLSKGIIAKFNNSCDTVWTSKLQHPDFTNTDITYSIRNLVELDNGDLIGLGYLQPFLGKKKIWIFKTDKNGCLYETDCDGILGNSNMPSQTLNIFPNPTKDFLNIEFEYEFNKCLILNNSSKVVQSIYNVDSKQLNVSSLSSGNYVLQIWNGKNLLISTSFIKI